ncbi:hypothetical protein THAR02_06446 [Trichoderma harzianum]|uniref:Uncharacterized protein n=1 Tax=Trichoderma harzianum TaxID=5544 RepID=A0A0F9XAA0_TRIHA|nr:hypothetical protein THAR02_06446 [Trichoderma harzianum]
MLPLHQPHQRLNHTPLLNHNLPQTPIRLIIRAHNSRSLLQRGHLRNNPSNLILLALTTIIIVIILCFFRLNALLPLKPPHPILPRLPFPREYTLPSRTLLFLPLLPPHRLCPLTRGRRCTSPTRLILRLLQTPLTPTIPLPITPINLHRRNLHNSRRPHPIRPQNLIHNPRRNPRRRILPSPLPIPPLKLRPPALPRALRRPKHGPQDDEMAPARRVAPHVLRQRMVQHRVFSFCDAGPGNPLDKVSTLAFRP